MPGNAEWILSTAIYSPQDVVLVEGDFVLPRSQNPGYHILISSRGGASVWQDKIGGILLNTVLPGGSSRFTLDLDGWLVTVASAQDAYLSFNGIKFSYLDSGTKILRQLAVGSIIQYLNLAIVEPFVSGSLIQIGTFTYPDLLTISPIAAGGFSSQEPLLIETTDQLFFTLNANGSNTGRGVLSYGAST